MKRTTILLITIFYISVAYSQDNWRLEINYGAQQNFFVKYDRTFNKKDGLIEPTYDPIFGIHELYQKNPVGNTLGIGIGYIRNKNTLYLGYQRTENKGKYKVGYQLTNGTRVLINQFTLRHINHFFELYLKHNIKANNKFFWKAGWYYMNPVQQEIEVYSDVPVVVIRERSDFSGHRMGDLGISAGIEYFFLSNKYFDTGVSSTFYYNLGYGSFENVGLSLLVNFKL